MREELLLALNPTRERLRPVSDGVDFLGYVVRPHYRLARRRVVNRMHERLATFERAMVREVPVPTPALRIDHEPAHVDALQATLASYLGHLRWAATRRLVAGLAQRHPFLCEHFRIDATAYRIGRRIPHRCPARRVKDQYAWWRRKYREDVVFFQVGRFVEFYQARDAQTARVLRLAAMQPNRRGARWGFRVSRMREYLARALDAGRTVVLVVQSPDAMQVPAARTMVARYAPISSASSTRRG